MKADEEGDTALASRTFDQIPAVRGRFNGMDLHDAIMSPTLYPAEETTKRGVLMVLAHGAGAGDTHPFMVRYARGLAARGIDVATFNFPYMQAGRRAPDKAPVLEDAFRNAVIAAGEMLGNSPHRLMIGGKSMGGRIATHLAAAPQNWPASAAPLAGVVALGYPLNPPGGARQDRVSHLFAFSTPLLIVQGTRDSFGGPDAVRAALGGRAPHVAIHVVEGGDHSFAVPKSLGRVQADVDREVLEAISAWLARVVLPRTPTSA
jgi:predicted alpha/beta-hydrolase family hydrolase